MDYIVEDKKTGEKRLWDGVSLKPIQPGAAQATQQFNQQLESYNQEANAYNQASAAQPPITLPPITAQPPRFPVAEKVLQQAAGPIATGLLGFATGGASIPAQMAIGGAIEAGGEKLAGEELSPWAIGGAALLPPAVRGTIQAGKAAVRSVANQVARSPMIEAAVQKTQKLVGVGKAGTEAVEAVKKSRIPMEDFSNTMEVIDDIVKKEAKIPGGSKEAIKIAKDTQSKLVTPAKEAVPAKTVKEVSPIVGPRGEAIEKVTVIPGEQAVPAKYKNFNYGEIFESTSALRETAEAAGDNRTLKRVYDIRQGLINDLDNLSPDAKRAFSLYRKQQAVKEISDIMRSGGFTQTKVARLMDKDPLISGAFNAAEKDIIKTISSQVGPEGLTKILSTVSALAAKGGTAFTAPFIVSALISSPKVGQAFARSLIGPEGEVSKVAMPAFVQFLRGYMASQGESK